MGVVSSVFIPLEKTGIPFNSFSVAGTGTGSRPCAQSTKPSPTFRGEDIIVSKFKDSIAHTPPTISMMESVPPISW